MAVKAVALTWAAARRPIAMAASIGGRDKGIARDGARKRRSYEDGIVNS